MFQHVSAFLSSRSLAQPRAGKQRAEPVPAVLIRIGLASAMLCAHLSARADDSARTEARAEGASAASKPEARHADLEPPRTSAPERSASTVELPPLKRPLASKAWYTDSQVLSAQSATTSDPEGSGVHEPRESTQVRAGIGEGLTVIAPKRRASLTVRARVQLRATGRAGGEPEGGVGFMVRRARLLLRGFLLSARWEYYIQLGFSNLDMEPDLRIPLRDAYVTWLGLRDLNVRFGQMKVPFNRQRVISSGAMSFADRTLVVSELNLDRDVGIQLMSTDFLGLNRRLSYSVGLFSGEGRNRITIAPGLLWVGRVQVAPFGGAFADYDEVAHQHETSPKLAIGLAGAYNQNSRRELSTFGNSFSTERTGYTHGAIDVIFRYAGLTLMSEALLRRANDAWLAPEGAPAFFTRSGWGYFFQSGYLFPKGIEIVGRYGDLYPLAGGSAVDSIREMGPGISYYFTRHDLKIQADYAYRDTANPLLATHEARLQVQLFL